MRTHACCKNIIVFSTILRHEVIKEDYFRVSTWVIKTCKSNLSSGSECVIVKAYPK